MILLDLSKAKISSQEFLRKSLHLKVFAASKALKMILLEIEVTALVVLA